MSKLPIVSGADALKAFRRLGWEVARQKGSHVTMVRPGSRLIITVPLHRSLDRGTLRRLIGDAGVSVEQFVAEL